MGAHFVIVMAQEILHTKKKTLWRGHKKNRGQKKDMGGRQRGRFVKKRGAPGGHYTHSTRVSTYTQKKKRRKKSFFPFFPSSSSSSWITKRETKKKDVFLFCEPLSTEKKAEINNKFNEILNEAIFIGFFYSTGRGSFHVFNILIECKDTTKRASVECVTLFF